MHMNLLIDDSVIALLRVLYVEYFNCQTVLFVCDQCYCTVFVCLRVCSSSD